MLLVQTSLNFFIPAGSGQAIVSMPLMAPIGDIVGLTRQTTVLAFQLGDGLMNMVVPTNPVLMGILGLAGIPYEKWFQIGRASCRERGMIPVGAHTVETK